MRRKRTCKKATKCSGKYGSKRRRRKKEEGRQGRKECVNKGKEQKSGVKCWAVLQKNHYGKFLHNNKNILGMEASVAAMKT